MRDRSLISINHSAAQVSKQSKGAKQVATAVASKTPRTSSPVTFGKAKVGDSQFISHLGVYRPNARQFDAQMAGGQS